MNGSELDDLENMFPIQPRARRGRAREKKAFCPHGHELTDANVVNDRNGRRCRICKNASQQRYRDRHPDYGPPPSRFQRARHLLVSVLPYVSDADLKKQIEDFVQEKRRPRK